MTLKNLSDYISGSNEKQSALLNESEEYVGFIGFTKLE
jgi:hypothetical protein